MSEFWWTELPWDSFFSQYFGFPCQYHAAIVPYLSSHTFLLPKEQTVKNGCLPNSNAVSGAVQYWIEKKKTLTYGVSKEFFKRC